jgi:hypothetical protein
MKQSFFILFIIAANISFAQQKFNVQNGAKTEFYNDLETAIQQAQAGDTIYLPPGICHADSDIVINKPLALIGIGGVMDTLQTAIPTQIDRQITFTSNASGSLFTGCKLTSYVYFGDTTAVHNIKFIRNNMGVWGSANTIYIYPGSSNIVIRENQLGTLMAYLRWVPYPHHCFIENNIFISNGSTVVLVGFDSSFITNNIFTATFSNITDINSCIIQNNYFKGSISFPIGINSIYNNNAFENNVNFSGSIHADNLVNQAWNDTFEDYINYKLKPTSPCKNAGIDGTDIGIYGGTQPYKERGIPFNPHVSKNTISSQVDNAGNLQIDIIVTSQER